MFEENHSNISLYVDTKEHVANVKCNRAAYVLFPRPNICREDGAERAEHADVLLCQADLTQDDEDRPRTRQQQTTSQDQGSAVQVSGPQSGQIGSRSDTKFCVAEYEAEFL